MNTNEKAPRRGKVPAAAEVPAAPEFPAPSYLDAAAAGVWDEMIEQHHEPARVAGPDLAAYCGQVALWRDLRDRVAREGSIIADERGRPEPHPAIALERAAQKEIRDWGDKFRGRPKRPVVQRGER